MLYIFSYLSDGCGPVRAHSRHGASAARAGLWQGSWCHSLIRSIHRLVDGSVWQPTLGVAFFVLEYYYNMYCSSIALPTALETLFVISRCHHGGGNYKQSST